MAAFFLPVAGRDELYEIRPSKIIALGLNYRDHVKESPSVLAAKASGKPLIEEPKEPILFCKTPNVLIPNGSPIRIPAILDSYAFSDPRTDYEAELAFIISKPCRNVRREEAFEFIFGYTCFNDVSQRDIQNSDRSGWFRGKSFDSFGPIGPRIVPASLLGDPQKLGIRCRLNGKTVQEGDTGRMIFDIPEIVSFVSRNLSLEAGDIISTGTPSGVGPIKDGDFVEIEIEGIGILGNPVVRETAPAR
jgi:2-keto-4-pentenoate hydratase/2-oxohepta-3-ene-1,7-dioic acid hydratase in catechol pathway